MSHLPVRPSLASLRKQAKSLLKGVRENDPDSLALVREHHPKPDSFLTLRDAQLAVARLYGHPGWAELCEAVQSALDGAASIREKAAQFADLACLLYNGQDDLRRWERAGRLLTECSELVGVDIYAAAAAFDVEAVRALLEADSGHVNRPGGPRCWTALQYLAYSRMEEEVPARDAVALARLLVEAGADVNTLAKGFAGGWRWTALTGVIGEGESGVVQQPPHPRAIEIAEVLLDSGAEPNDSQGLYNSSFTPGNEWLELLLSRGLTSEDRVDPDGDSPVTTLDFQLSQAVSAGYTDRVVLLLKHGANADGSDAWYTHRTHVETALLNGFSDISALLVERGAEQPDLSLEDAFRAAVMAGDEAEAGRLLESDPTLIEQPRMMVVVARNGRIEPLRLLLEMGASPDLALDNGRVALHGAAWAGHTDTVTLLLDSGASCDVRENDYGSTPAGFANHAGRYELRDFLLERSNDVFDLVWYGNLTRLKTLLGQDSTLARATRPDGRTPLHSVNSDSRESAKVIDLLLEHGADIHAVDDDGKTPLAYAVEGQNDAVAHLLKDHGATR